MELGDLEQYYGNEFVVNPIGIKIVLFNDKMESYNKHNTFYSMYENDDENLHDEVTYEYEGRNLNEILEMAVDDEIDFEDSMVINYDAHSRLIETSSDLVYIHEYDDYYKEYQHDMTEELSDAYQKVFDKKMNEFSG